MKFHIEFSYPSENREKLIRLLDAGGLSPEGPLKILGAWVAVQTGVGYALVATDDAKALYQLASTWSDFGQVKLTPVIDAGDI